MNCVFQPPTGVLTGTSFENQVKAFLARAAVGSFPASSYQSVSTAGAGTDGPYGTISATAPSAGWYSIVGHTAAKIMNNSNGMASNSVPSGGGEGCCIMPVSAGQSVTFHWQNNTGVNPNIRFIPAVEA